MEHENINEFLRNYGIEGLSGEEYLLIDVFRDRRDPVEMGKRFLSAPLNSGQIRDLNFILDSLTGREEKVLKSIYGIAPEEKVSPEILGRRMFCGTDRLMMIKIKAFQHLRNDFVFPELERIIDDGSAENSGGRPVGQPGIPS